MPYKNKLKKKQYNEQFKIIHPNYYSQWYQDNKENQKKYMRQYYSRRKKIMNDYKLSRGCAICGYNKCAGALDFHHFNDDKTFNVSRIFNHNLKEIETEMSKCQILCRNCHSELHARITEIATGKRY